MSSWVDMKRHGPRPLTEQRRCRMASGVLAFACLSLITGISGVTSAAAAGKSAKAAHQYGYGTTPTTKQIKAWNIDVLPDGKGLPPGKGSVTDGESLFGAKCAACHGMFAQGVAKYPNLNDPSSADLKAEPPVKTIGNFWPYAPKIFSYIHKTMPFPLPGSLTADQTYAITAYLLNVNNIVPSDFVADAKTLPKVKMPNRNGFIVNDLKPDTYATECMKNCASGAALKIKTNAKDLNGLTPPTTGPLNGGDS